MGQSGVFTDPSDPPGHRLGRTQPVTEPVTPSTPVRRFFSLFIIYLFISPISFTQIKTLFCVKENMTEQAANSRNDLLSYCFLCFYLKHWIKQTEKNIKIHNNFLRSSQTRMCRYLLKRTRRNKLQKQILGKISTTIEPD